MRCRKGNFCFDDMVGRRIETNFGSVEGAVRYLIMIHSNTGRVEGSRSECYDALVEELVASGEMIASESLADASLTKCISVRGGQTTTTDGPFSEMHESLAGFLLVECESIERALEHAARLPAAACGLVEVRPILASVDADDYAEASR